MQPHADHTHDTTERVAVSEAAEVLGITAEAVRQRIRRGTLPSEKDDAGSVFVLLDPRKHQSNRQPHAEPTQPYDDHTTDNTVLYERMAQEIEYLRDQLDRAERRDQENRRLLAAALERIPAIEAPEDTSPEAREYPQTAPEHRSGTQTPQEEEQRERSWWQRWFGG